MPGLVDAHVHLEHFDDPSILAVFLSNGVTTVRNMDGRPFILDWRHRIAAGDLLGPIYTAGPILDGDPPILDDNTIVRTAADARAAVAAQDSAGYNFIKVYTNAVGTDTPNPFVVPGFSVHEEIANFVDAGFTPRDALGAATREGARLLGQLVEFGTVEVGKRADLVLLAENPLMSLDALKHPLGVMTRGRWMPAAVRASRGPLTSLPFQLHEPS